MNHGKHWCPGGRRGSRGRSSALKNMDWRRKSESPVTVDRSLDESSGNRGRVRCSSGYANDEHSPVEANIKKSSQVSDMGFVEKVVQQEDKIGASSSKQHGQGAAFIYFGINKDLLQSSALCSSKNKNLSGVLYFSREFEDVKDVSRMRCGLVNPMKDDSRDYVSCTSDQKVEISNVENQDSAHKSGDAGNNSSNESKTKPFDLFLRTKVMGLKPSLLVLNRDKKKATRESSGICIRPGMVLLKNYLSINDQVMIVNKCRQLGLGEGGFYQPGYSDRAKLRLKMMCLGKHWDPETSQYGETRPVDGSTPPQIPVEFSQLVGKAIKESQSLVAKSSKTMKGEDEIPFMSPDICIANFYTSTGRLGLHQDKDESDKSIRKGLPVVSFSIGDSAEFLYGDKRDAEKAEEVVLESGDVLIFGGKSRNVFHGVRSILKDTAPKVLLQESSLRPGRLNLTFRQY